MQAASGRRIGILAGGGSLPLEIAQSLARRGASVTVVGIEGEFEDALSVLNPVAVNWGQIGRMVQSFRRAGCRELVIVGGVRRPDLAAIKPDLGFFRALPTVLRLVRAGGDDAVLRGVIGFFETKGLRVVGAAELAPELVIGAGRFAQNAPEPADEVDIAMGFRAVAALAPFDVGQAIVVAEGRIEAIEGAEGTDRMLERVAALRRRRMLERCSARRGVLVKRPKPGQELRIDLPVIGPDTVRRVAEADLAGIAVEAGLVLAARREDLRSLADAQRVFVAGIAADGDPTAAGARGTMAKAIAAVAVEKAARRRLDHRLIRDARKGAAVIAALEPFGGNRVAIVDAGHVLAVEAGEGIEAAIERAAGLKQWGSRGSRRRTGVAVLAAGRDLSEEILGRIAEAGLSCAAVMLRKFAAGVPDDLVAVADRLGLAIAAIGAGDGGASS